VSGANAIGRQPAFSPDDRFFYQPMGLLDAVLVIDTATKQVVTQIPVGSNPSVVVAQGDVGPQELQ
jgi:DNA-binding beta-propeller fold protein YncE